MSVFPSTLQTIMILGSLQGFILAFILLAKKNGNKTANRILASIILYLSFAIILHALSHAGILPLLTTHVIILGITTVLISPLLYFYVIALTSYNFSFRYKDGFHFLPFVFCCLMILLLFLYKSNIINIHPFNENSVQNIIDTLSFLTFSFYIILAGFKLASHTKFINNNFSNLEKIKLRWLRTFLFLLTFLLVFAAVFDLIFNIRNWDIIWLVCCAIIYIISYFGLAQPIIFADPGWETTLFSENKRTKYTRSSLSSEKSEQYLLKLRSEMKRQKSYIDKNISLAKLAKDIGISSHHLSQIINEKLNMNFYDFINSQRTKEAAEQLADPDKSHLSIAAIAFDVGFNSLSAFNAAFKKFTDFTPSQYRKKG